MTKLGSQRMLDPDSKGKETGLDFWFCLEIMDRLGDCNDWGK